MTIDKSHHALNRQRQKAYREKKRFHKSQAKRPVHEKIASVINLQRIANQDSRDGHIIVWKIALEN